MAHTYRFARSLPSRACRLISVFCLLLLLLTHTPAQTPNEIIYIYDELGRLIGVVDPAGETAVSTYDAVGNLLSITRHSSSLVSVIEFTPNGGAIDTPVTIYGTGFSATPGQNTVTFNGVSATVISSTATRLLTTVPSGATTGLIAVTTSNGSASSGTPFTVGDSTTPTITSFTPTIGTAGTSVTITGTNFETVTANNRAFFYGDVFSSISAATGTTLNASVPVGTSGPITVTTLSGRCVSSQDFFIPPAPYTADDVGQTGRMLVGGTKVLTVNSGKIAMILFDGTAGQRVGLSVAGMTIPWPGSASLKIISPDGTTLSTGYADSSGGYIDALDLPATGIYTILVQANYEEGGSMTMTLNSIVDVTGVVVADEPPITVATVVPGQNARLTFAGTAGQRVSLRINGVTTSGGNGFVAVYLNAPDSSNLYSTYFSQGDDLFIDTQTLPVNGNYTIFIDPYDNTLTSVSLTLANVPPDITGTITPGGSSVTVTNTAPGQNARLTFSGTVGQRVSLNVANVSVTSADVYILKPDGTTLISEAVEIGDKFFDAQTLPAAGTYTILVDPAGMNTGSVTLTLYDAADVTTTVTPGGSSVTVTTTAPGQNFKVTFDGTASDVASLHVSGVTVAGTSALTIKKPNGAIIAWDVVDTIGGFVNIASLPVTGTYTIYIDPSAANTGSMTLTLDDALPDDPDAPTITELTPAIGIPGASLTITGTNFETVAADNRVLLNNQALTPVGSVTGTTINANVPATGSGRISVTTASGKGVSSQDFFIPPDPYAADDVGQTGRMLVGGTKAVSLNTAGKVAMILFDGTAGQRVGLNVSDMSMTSDCFVSVLYPDGSFFTGTYINSSGGGIDVIDLPTNGTYTLLVDPYDTGTGDLTLNLNEVPPDITGTIVVNGQPVTVTTTLPGQRVLLTFTGTTPDVVTVSVTDNAIGETTVKLISPENWTYVESTSSDASFNLSPQTLYTSGTHTIFIKPGGTNTGSMTVTLTKP